MTKDLKKVGAQTLPNARILRRFATLCFLMLAAISPLAQESTLTVQETLGGVFVGGSAGSAVAKAGNPAAKPILYKILDKPQMKDHQGRIYLMLGYLGDERDAAILEKRLQQLTPAEWGVVDKILSALSTMQLRGVSQAGMILERMTQPRYWQDTKFTTVTNIPYGATNELAICALFAYARSGKPAWNAKVESFKEAVRDPKIRAELEWRLDPITITKHVEEARAAKVPPISPELRKLLSQLFNGDINNPGPATEINIPRHAAEAQDDTPPKVTAIKTLGAQELASLKLEALNAFNIIQDAFLNERYEQLALTLARRGKPLVPIASNDVTLIPDALKELKRISAHGGFEYTKKIIKDLNPQAIPHGEPKGEVLSDGTTVVRIPCLGSEPVKTKHLPSVDSSLSPTVDEDGQLNIYMLKQGNHWYWNPFGW